MSTSTGRPVTSASSRRIGKSCHIGMPTGFIDPMPRSIGPGHVTPHAPGQDLARVGRHHPPDELGERRPDRSRRRRHPVADDDVAVGVDDRRRQAARPEVDRQEAGRRRGRTSRAAAASSASSAARRLAASASITITRSVTRSVAAGRRSAALIAVDHGASSSRRDHNE